MQRNSSVVRRYRSMPFMFGLMAMLLAGVLALTGCSGDESEAVSEISGNIVISEVMSTNSYYLPLADGSCHDWIEFHNISQSAVNLKGCMLSDKARTANKWKVMTDLVIQPDGYGLIILSGLDKVDEQGYIHANFKLSSKGENLIFSDPSLWSSLYCCGTRTVPFSIMYMTPFSYEYILLNSMLQSFAPFVCVWMKLRRRPGCRYILP